MRKKVLLIFFVAFVFSFGYVLGKSGLGLERGKVTISRNTPNNKNVDFSLFWQVWDDVEKNYYDSSKISESDMVYGAIGGMVAALGDPYTVFLTPSENSLIEQDMQGNFDGVGIEIGFSGTQLAVISPLPDSPAEKSGVKAGDFIVGIKDEVKDLDIGTFGMSLQEAVRDIRGPAGTKVTLTLLRKGEQKPLVIDISRGNIEVASVTLTMEGKNKNIAHITLSKFGGDTENEWNRVVTDILKQEDIRGIVLDMRGNPGGYLQGAVQLGSDFLGREEVVVIEQRGSEKIDYKSQGMGRLLGESVVVLVDGGSASASEILAGALRDQLGVKLVGTTTFGKGTVQERQDLPGGVALHITSAKWLTPDGTWVNGKGLEPDVKVEDDPETLEDEQLVEAIRLLNL